MLNKNDFSKIGLGTWGIGGLMKKDPLNNDKKQVEAISYAIKNGVNYLEGAPMYAEGKALKILAEGIKSSGLDRNKLFITLTFYINGSASFKKITDLLNSFLVEIDSSCIDNIQFEMNLIRKLGLRRTSHFVDGLIQNKKIKFISITNANLEYLKRCKAIFGKKLFAHEEVYNFEIRHNEQLGITQYVSEAGMLNVVYQPLRRNRTAQRMWPILKELAKKYHKSQNQIILNWISSKGFLPLVKSTNIQHIQENIDSFNFKIEKKDIDRLNDFHYPEIDWYDQGKGILIHQLPNKFDDLFPKDEAK